ncbi:MAG: hypothetical protein Q8P20_05490 [bacterium]|nr:hypothetical protein [bacterium]
MTNEQFLKDLQHHLEVGGPQREEIVREVTSHLQEQSAEQLGDSAVVARKMNRVHLGFFASFRSLAIAAAITTVLFDVIIHYVAVRYNSSGTGSALLQFFWSIVPFVSPVLFIYGAHAISRMRNRWIYTAVFAAIFAVGFAIQQELMQAIGYLLISTVSGSTSVWSIHIQPIVTFLITYAIIGYAVMAIMAGRQLIVSRHQVIDIILAFILGGAAARFLLPMIWNAITSFHYTMAMSEWSASVFQYLTAVSIGIGLLCAGIEWLRIRSVKKLAIIK